tara:strand:- start:123 stop:599 length:477 start_codon:yes stop_codon:yes gene_type:complete
MSGSLNKVQLIGNLGRDPEIRTTNDGRNIAHVTLATSENWKDASGQRQERTEWHRIVVFGGLADVVKQYLKKGDSAYFEGRIQTRKWTDNSNQERYTTEIVVDQKGAMQMLGSRGGASDSSYAQSAPAENFDQSSSGGMAMNQTKVSDDAAFDDDIPF